MDGIAGMAGVVLILMGLGCDMQTAGTSVGTGNPTEIQVAFTQDVAGTPLSGRLELYATTQIPVPGFHPSPLATVAFSHADKVAITSDALKNVADSLWPAGSVEGDSIYHFNLVVMGDSAGAVVRDFGWNKLSKGFTVVTGALRSGDVEAISVGLKPWAPAAVRIDSAELSPNKDNYLFLYGTGFSARGVGGRFDFSALPPGAQNAYLISLPTHADDASGADSLFIYGLKSSIQAGGTNSVGVGTFVGEVPLPDSLKKL